MLPKNCLNNPSLHEHYSSCRLESIGSLTGESGQRSIPTEEHLLGGRCVEGVGSDIDMAESPGKMAYGIINFLGNLSEK